MRCTMIGKAGLLLALIGTAAPALAAPPRATTAAGTIEGTQQRDVAVFRGIPYAAAPTGPNRWRAPQPASRWTGIRPATRFGHSCWQAVAPQGFGPWTHEYVVSGDISEDCLFLNVWAPAKRSRPAPVLFWVHGGGFNSGSGAIPIYDGAALAAGGAVVVTINYRVGVFGFLARPDLTHEASGQPTANFGLLDIVAALRWVQANIASFGGDPRNVTLAGQSAGAMAVQELVASPLAKGLFQRAIGESGLPRPLASLSTAEQQGEAFATEKHATSIADLRALPPEALQPSAGSNAVRFTPVADGRLIPEGPWRPASDVPMLVGLTADDNSAFGPDYASADPDKLHTLIETSFGTTAGQLGGLYPTNTAAERSEASKQIRRDLGEAAVDAWARQRAVAARTPVYSYVFAHAMPSADTSRWGAFHSSEIPYVFGTFAASPERRFTPVDDRVSHLMSGYWLNFIKRGDPNGPGLTAWPTLTAEAPQVLRIADVTRAEPLLPSAKLTLLRQHLDQNR